MSGRRILLLIFVALAAVIAYHFAKPFIAGKRCMDSGGRWDTQTGACLAPFEEPPE